MELASKYDPQAVESKWYQYWLDNKLFSSKPDGRQPYTPAKRNGCATHGPHAQQYYTGHSRASCSHGGQERMLGAGHRPCFHRYRG